MSNNSVNLENWTPIGTYGWTISAGQSSMKNYFAGVFDGCGHTISNFAIKTKTKEQYGYLNNKESFHVGFFGLLKGTVQNVKFKDVKIDMYDTSKSFTTFKNNAIKESFFQNSWDAPFSVGCVAGAAVNAQFNQVKVENCYIRYVQANGTNTSDSNFREFFSIGGISGASFKCEFSNCESDAKISVVAQDFYNLPLVINGTMMSIGGISGGSAPCGGYVFSENYESECASSKYTNCFFYGNLQCVGRLSFLAMGGISGRNGLV